MKLPQRRRRDVQEPVVPLINVVFLLLVFFLLTGTLRPREELDVLPPERIGEGEGSPANHTLWLDADGRLASREETIDPAEVGGWWSARRDPEGVVQLRADGRVAARHLLPLLERLDAAGVPEVTLATSPLR